MRVLCIHPGGLLYTKIFLRLEPLGLEVVAGALRSAGHVVDLTDLQAESRTTLLRRADALEPQMICIACNYLANVPEVVDLAKDLKARFPRAVVLVGGHSVSFIADQILDHAEGAIDCVLRGEGEATICQVAEIVAAGDFDALPEVPGMVTAGGKGPRPIFIENLDDSVPARDLLRHRRRYFIGMLDPAASVEFSRGCPWDCSFCSAWTFYGRSYRVVSPERAVDELKAVRQAGVFLVDDVAFIQGKQGMAIGEAVASAGIRKQYYMETRADVLLRNKEVFRLWRKLGLEYLFLGIEAIDADGLDTFRKRSSVEMNDEALAFARSLGLQVAVNLIADPDWDRERFRVIRQWALEVPEIVNISINTPYPGTESWQTNDRALSTRDYRLFDIQHAVMPTKLPLAEFYAEMIETQKVMAMKHLGWSTAWRLSGVLAGRLARGQTNFLRMLFKFNSVYSVEKLLADHAGPVRYELPLPPEEKKTNPKNLYIHAPGGRRGRALDKADQEFVAASR
ncbi:MAG: hopanoid C-3 methylase HpnR [Pseudomonadota bacterium]